MDTDLQTLNVIKDLCEKQDNSDHRGLARHMEDVITYLQKQAYVGLEERWWQDTNPRDRDRWIAKNIFDGTASWEKHPYAINLCPYEEGPREWRGGMLSNYCTLCGAAQGYHDNFPQFTTAIGADYLVLEHVRNKWDDALRRKFSNYAHKLADYRLSKQDVGYTGLYITHWYEPGDYSHVAYLAKELPC